MSDADERSHQTAQPPLFDVSSPGRFGPEISGVGPLTPTSSLEVARFWFRRYLEQDRRPINTVRSYLYDLSRLEQVIGLKRIDEITQRDIARFLGDAGTRSTRKRRLTSTSTFFKWLVHQTKMLEKDPTESFYPDEIPLKTPQPLFARQQEALLEAAVKDSSRSALMCWLMLRLGLTRGEVLGLGRSHIDFADDGSADIYVFYEQARNRGKERRLRAGPEFKDLYDAFLKDFAPEEKLFDMLPQSVNKMVDRVAKAARIEKRVTPQTLRDTFAVEMARDGADEDQLLRLLGLVDEKRNRMSVQRYLKLAGPPVNEGSVPGQRELE